MKSGSGPRHSGSEPRPALYSVGHSNRPLEDFLNLLRAHGIRRVVDIRTIPKSRHNPQFSAERLRPALAKARIGYEHAKALGGLRRPRADSRNAGWRNAGFRGFADYMQTPEFERALAGLAKKAGGRRKTAMLCAEAVPWRCHRSLVADALSAKRVPVFHILSAAEPRRHKRTPFARLRAGRVVYPATRKAGA